MITNGTYLAPGQRYAPIGLDAWRVDHQITVMHVGRDDGRPPRVTYRCPNGEEVLGLAADFEAAVAGGQLVPVAGTGRIARC